MNRLKQQSSLLTVWDVNSHLNLMLFKLIREKVEARNVSLDHFTYCRKPPDFISVFLYKKEDWKEGLESEDTTHGMKEGDTSKKCFSSNKYILANAI